jgi:hypothetical protein
MAFNFPSTATDGQIYELFGKKWQFDSSLDAWKTYLVGSGSNLGDLSNVIAVDPDDEEFLTWDGRRWKPSGSADVGAFLKDIAASSSLSGSTYYITDNNDSVSSFDYIQKVWYDGTNLKTGSIDITIDEVGYVETASSAINVETASIYDKDIYLTGMSFDDTSSVHFSRSYGQPALTQTFGFGKLKSVNGITGSGATTNNIAVEIANVSTGLSSSFPASPADADVYIVSGETAAERSGSNGLVYIYAASASAWFEISAPSDSDKTNKYVNKSGDTMHDGAHFQITSSVTPTDDLHIVTKDYVDDLAFQSGSRAMQGWYQYLTAWRWIAAYYTDAQHNRTLYNDTDGNIEARTWVTRYTIPNNVNFMSFQCGLEQSRLNHISMYHVTIINDANFNPLAKASVHSPGRGRQSYYSNPDPQWNINVTINTGPVPVTANQRLRMFFHGDSGTGTLARGINRGNFFSGYVHKTVNPDSLSDIRTLDGLEGGGTGGVLTIRVDDTVARTNTDNSFTAAQQVNDVIGVSESTTVQDFDATGTSVLPGKLIMAGDIDFQLLAEYKNDNEAAANSVPLNGLYRNGNLLMIRVT